MGQAAQGNRKQPVLLDWLSDCQKSLAEFAPAGAKKVKSIFPGGATAGASVKSESFLPVSPVGSRSRADRKP